MWEIVQQIGIIILWVLLGIVSLLVAFIVFACVCSLFVSKNKDYAKDSKLYRFLLHSITSIVLFFSNVKVHVTGKEKIPKGRFLIASNHRSCFDALCTWNTFRRHQIACISKPSNFKIPFFGNIAKRCCFMAIDRENARNAIKTVNFASELMTNDVATILVYPEGTRSKTKEILPFHNMMFRMAQKAQVPIVVCTVSGSEKVHKRAPFRRTHVYVDIIEVIPTQEVLDNRTNDLGDKIYQTMVENLNQRENQG